MKSRKQWTFVITSPLIKVKRNSQDWKNCWKSHSMYLKSLCYLDTMITPRIGMNISRALRSIRVTSPQVFYLFASWTTWEIQHTIPKHFLYIKDLTGFKQRICCQNDLKNRNLSRNKKYRFCDFSDSQTAVQNHEEQIFWDQIDERDQYELESQQTHLQFTNQRFEMPAPVVMYADFESAIDEKNRPKSSYCPFWLCHESQQSKLNCKYSMHHTKKRTIFILSWTIWFNYKRVWRDIYSKNCYWKWHQRSRDIIGLPLYVHSVTRNWRVTRWDIMHMCQTNTRMVLRWSITRLDNTFSPVVPSAIYNSQSTRRTIDCQCTSTRDLTITSHSL